MKKKYGYTGEKLEDLTAKIIAENSETMARKIARTSQEELRKKATKLGLDPKRLTFPELDEIFPGRSVFITKAAQSGKLISETMRKELTSKLRESMKEFGLTARAGVAAGRVKRDMIKDFESKIGEVFDSYTKKDPKLGMPSSIHNIAVTEARSTANQVKKEYSKKLIDANGLRARKRWIHNRSLSKVPRGHHLALDGKTIDMNEKFEVKSPEGIVYMDHPHDPSAPAREVIGCNCDYEVLVSK